MSLDVNFYMIAGYDLSEYRTDKYDEFIETNKYDELIAYQKEGNIQLFDDPMSGNHLYLGYIIGASDSIYGDILFKIEDDAAFTWEDKVKEVRDELIKLGVIDELAAYDPYQIMTFNEVW